MPTALAYNKNYAFNAICPYYTMFPLEYPLGIIRKHQRNFPVIFDPFCGRGTTLYAGRLLGLRAYGFDTSPIAAAIARAKLASASADDVLDLGEELLARSPRKVPVTPFFRRAYSPKTLSQICSLREGLLREATPTDSSAILRAAVLGCLHGPLLQRSETPSYFSNQMPRTFSSKPDYSVRFWKERDLKAPKVSVIDVLEKKLDRITDLDSHKPSRLSNVKCADARMARSYRSLPPVSLIVTSPPYYGMRTYIQDQWLRMWFLGGDETVPYDNDEQLSHTGHDIFVKDLAKVWKNVARHAADGAHLYVRFGTLPSAKSDAHKLLRNSLEEAGEWSLVSVRSASTAEAGKRQADQMGRGSEPDKEYDFHAILA